MKRNKNKRNRIEGLPARKTWDNASANLCNFYLAYNKKYIDYLCHAQGISN
jgi:hypothetical protein